MINNICSGKSTVESNFKKAKVCGSQVCTKLELFFFLVPSLLLHLLQRNTEILSVFLTDSFK